MFLNTDRATGLFLAVLGIAFYLFVIPNQVDSSQGSWVLPDTIPNVTALIISFCGVLLIFKPTAHSTYSFKTFLRAGLFLMLLVAGIYIMSHVGFIYAAPVIALTLMLIMGEKRISWLLCGTAGTPLVIWYVVTELLERGLP